MSNLNQNLKQEAKEGYNSIKGKIAESGDALKDQAAKIGEKISDKSEEIVNAVRDKAAVADKEFSGLVKANPYIAVASALITGWLIAKIL